MSRPQLAQRPAAQTFGHRFVHEARDVLTGLQIVRVGQAEFFKDFGIGLVFKLLLPGFDLGRFGLAGLFGLFRLHPRLAAGPEIRAPAHGLRACRALDGAR